MICRRHTLCDGSLSGALGTLNRNNVLLRWGAAFIGPHMLASLAALPRYIVDWTLFSLRSNERGPRIKDSYPCLLDRRAWTPFDPHYFYQAAWLARRLAELEPTVHVDIGSSAMMVNVLSATVKTVFVDYRPLRVRLSNLTSVAGDILQLPFRSESVASLSSLHVVEHVGLGRYGDPVNPLGAQQAAAELGRVLMTGGRLFLSVPVGRERVCFNAHRVHAPSTVLSYLSSLQLQSFALVDDSGHYHENATFSDASGLDYGCGMFEFLKVS